MKSQKTTYILVIILILIILYGITTFYLDKKIVREHFKGQPPSEYINLLPSDPADIPKINVKGTSFNTKEVKVYFPDAISKGKPGKGGILVPGVDCSKMAAVSWKVLDEFNVKLDLMNDSLDQMNKTLVSSNEMLDLLKEKCK